MKEALFQANKKLKAFAALQTRKMKRLFVKTKMTGEECFNIPIVLNNRNRYTYLRDLVNWLQAAGYKNIFILDNDSDYPALLDYYKGTTAKVIYLKKNVGYKALWQTDLYEELKNKYYVYSDADLIPGKDCPDDFIYTLYQVLTKYDAEKCGPALRIDDLPEHYEFKQKVLNNEKIFWEKSLEFEVYDAPIDTTFALYKPFAFGDAEECKAIRVGGKLTFVHRPWYENSASLDEETQYYIKHASSSSFWYTKAKTIK